MKIGRIRNLSAQALAGVWLAGAGMVDAMAVPILVESLYAEQIHRDYYYKYEYPGNGTGGQYNLAQDWSSIELYSKITGLTNLAGALIQIDSVSAGVTKTLSGILPTVDDCAGSGSVRCYDFHDWSSNYHFYAREYFVDGYTNIIFTHSYNKAEYYNASGTYSYHNGEEVIEGDPSSFQPFGDDLVLAMTINSLDGNLFQGLASATLPDYSYSNNLDWTCHLNNTFCKEFSDEKYGKQFSGVPTNIDISPIPEPTVLSLLGLGLLGLGWSRTQRAG